MAASTNMVILEQDHNRFVALLEQVCSESNAKFAFLIDKNGQQIASAGDLGMVDPTSMASLAAGNVAATEGLAAEVGEDAFSSLYHEGVRDSLHMSQVATRFILLVSFDALSSLGLVRLRVEQYTPSLATALNEVMTRSQQGTQRLTVPEEMLPEITDEDIDALFG